MKTIYGFIFLLLIISAHSYAQKVGLVLSGGGSRGITHIGVIKALEENNIPIDYITGTSMGAIVGSMYAIGMTTDQMADLIKSPDFNSWSSGEIESGFKYEYRFSDPKPAFIEIPFRINRTDTLQPKAKPLLPTNLVSPHPMNFAFVPLYARGTAAAKGDFNQLLVPFRCVASDVYKKEAVIFNRGNLSEAVRASMTFPFMFKPLTIDGRVLFDGGIFNNFPVDVMQKDFNPDFMIGSAVVDNPQKPNESDIVTQIQNLIMNKSNYHIDKELGITLNFKLETQNMFDFSKVDELIQLGYDSTMKHIDEIKARVGRKKSTEELANEREEFKAKMPELLFKNVIVTGVDSMQRKYVEKFFHYQKEAFTVSDFKEAYYKLVADDKIMEVVPKAFFNENNGYFDLFLNVKIQNKMKLLVGGNISSTTSNQGFIGLNYQSIGNISQSAHVDAQIGTIYDGFSLSTRFDNPSLNHMYIKALLVVHNFDYYKNNRIFYSENKLTHFNQFEAYAKLSGGLPVGKKSRFEYGVGYGKISNNYSQNSDTISTIENMDKSSFMLGSIFVNLEGNTLDYIMYPTKGSNYYASAQIIGGKEKFTSRIHPTTNKNFESDTWGQLKAKFDYYYPVNKKINIGSYGEINLSSRNLLHNYTISIIQAGAFRPTPHSQTIFNEGFSANQFAAFGVKPIYLINQQFHLRAEAYVFLPFLNIQPSKTNGAEYSKPFNKQEFLFETTLVYNLKFASAGLFTNYYSTGANRWNIGLNIGILLFNDKFIH